MSTGHTHAGPAIRTPAPDEDVTVVDIIRDGGNRALAAAVERCLTDPEDSAAWAGLEAASVTLPEVGYVAELYSATLDRKLTRETLIDVGARALRFYDEWAFSEDTVVALLERVLLVDPRVVWAFERLSLELATRGRYAELLTAYDRGLAAFENEPRHAALLLEAADVARDGAGDVDRAIVYLDRLFRLDPQREAVAASLERMLAQKGRHQELLAHWQRRIESGGRAQAVVLRCGAARFCLETMNDPVAATAMLLPLSVDEGEDEAATLLEKVLQAPSASPATRSDVLGQLRHRYDAQGKSAELIRPLRAFLARETNDPVAIQAEIVRLLVAEGRDTEALDDLAALVARQPASETDVLDRLFGDAPDLELAGCRPRIDPDGRRELVRRAATLAASVPERVGWAIQLYRRLLLEVPADAAVISGLAGLYEAGGEHAALIELRHHQLTLETDGESRRALRLQIAELSLKRQDTPAAVEVLSQNLQDVPTDPDVIGVVVATLEKYGQLAAVCDLLERHASTLPSSASTIAIDLWAKAASIAETILGDRRRTIADHALIVAVSPEPASFDALARLHTELGEHADAIEWLKRLLATTSASALAQSSNVLRLSAAHLAAEQPGEALGCVETRLVDEPGDLRLHMMQIELRRSTRDREAFVLALVDAARYAEPAVAAALLREAATVLLLERDAPARAVLLLERVVVLRPDVESLSLLADALHRTGRREEARATAKEALSECGDRHPPERASLHFLLGRIAHELEMNEEARRELESAVKTDMGNLRAHLLLGKLCRVDGDLDRAERALHAALLLQRRGLDEALPPKSETLLELHRVAVARGDKDRAAENLAAAFDLATGDAREARGLTRALRDAHMSEPLLRALDLCLQHGEELAERAAILADRSTILLSLDRPEEAIEAALGGLGLAPADPRLHGLARAASVEARRLAPYADILESLVTAALGAGDGVLGCGLLLRLGELCEGDLGRLDAAEAAYARAEDTSENLIEVWRRRARVAHRLGDHETELLLLRRLADSTADLEVSEQADTLYTLAELELGATGTLEAGLASLARALETEPRRAKAAAALRRALDIADHREPIARTTWAIELLIDAEEESGDLRGALQWVLLAAEVREGEESSQFSARAAELATKLGDLETALASYERMLADEPSNPDVWASTLDAYRTAGDIAKLEDALARAAHESCDPAERVHLHMERARLLVGDEGREADAKDALQAVLAEQPDHAAAADLLSGLLDPKSERDELVVLLTRRLEIALERGESSVTQLALRLAELTPQAEAVEVVRAALGASPANAPLLGRFVELLDPQADAEERADAIDRLLALSENLVHNRVPLSADLVRARMAASDADATERALDLLLSIEPGHPAIEAALVWLAQTRIDDAAHHPEDAGNLLYRAARFQERLGDKEAGLETLARAYQAAADDPDILELYTRRLIETGRGNQAIEVASEAVSRSTQPRVRAACHAMRASLRTLLGDHEGAVTDLEEAQSQAGGWLPELIDALERARAAADAEDSVRALSLRETDVLEAMGRVDDARDLLAQMSDDDPAVLRRLFVLDVMTEQWASAVIDGERLMGTTEGSELAYVAVTVGDALLRIRRPEEARAALERAHDADPSNDGLLDRLRELYMEAGAFRELSIRLLSAAKQTTAPHRRFEHLLEVGRLRLEHLGEAAAAIGPLFEALEIQPDEPRATSLLVDAFAEAGLIDDAVALIGAAIERQGPRRCRELSDLQRRMARVLSKRDKTAALNWLTLAFDSQPKSPDAAKELAELAIALGELDVAVRALRALTSKNCDPEVRARAYVAQAAIALRQGNKGKAEAFAKKAHAEAPDLAEVEALVRRLGREVSRASAFDLSAWVELSAWTEPHGATGGP
jgi:tetratricopeptide (TPR) repeat protein